MDTHRRHKLYDAWAPTYDGRLETGSVPLSFDGYEQVLRTAFEHARASAGMRVLDLGTGTATFRAGPGEHVTCTFFSIRDDVAEAPGTIIVAQETVPDGDPTDFPYTGVVVGQARDGQRLIQGGLQPGTYTSQQIVPRGWALSGIQCDDGVGSDDRDSSGDIASATATFRLQPGEDLYAISGACTEDDLVRMQRPVLVAVEHQVALARRHHRIDRNADHVLTDLDIEVDGGEHARLEA